MTDEEKKAIEVLKNMDIEIDGESTCKKCIFSDEVSCFRDGKDCQMKAIETVLNLIEKQQSEIETLKRDFEIDKKIESVGKVINYICKELEED